MTVRDFAAMRDAVELIPGSWSSTTPARSRATRSWSRCGQRPNQHGGFHAFREAYEPGRTAAEVLAPAERLFVEEAAAG